MTEVDFNAIVQAVRDRGQQAHVKQTGGGVATIYAGPLDLDEEGFSHRAVLVGPGWFDGPGWTLPRGDTADLYMGSERDDSAFEPVVVDNPDVSAIADRVVGYLAERAQ